MHVYNYSSSTKKQGLNKGPEKKLKKMIFKMRQLVIPVPEI